MKDLHNNIAPVRVISPISPVAVGVIAGQVIDMAGRQAVEFVISSGAQITAGITVTPVVKAGSATGSLASAPDTDLLGTEAAAAAFFGGATGANKVAKIGYTGRERYVTCDLVVAGAATGTYAVNALQAGPRKAPV